MQTSVGAFNAYTRSKSKAIRKLRSMDNSTTKQCSACSQYHPRTLEYFPPRKDSKDGLLGRCRICQSAYDAQKYLDNKDAYIARSAKRYHDKHDEILEQYRAKYQENPEKYRTKSMDYHYANRDVSLATMRRSWRKNKEKRNAEQRLYRQENPEKYKASIVKSRAKKPDLYARISKAIGQRYRARKRGLPDTLTTQEWQLAIDYFNGCCAACGRPAGLWHRLAMDHWIPLDVENCPGTIKTNCIPLCHGADGCNNSKHNKMPDVWLNRKFGKRKAKQIIDRVESYFRSLM